MIKLWRLHEHFSRHDASTPEPSTSTDSISSDAASDNSQSIASRFADSIRSVFRSVARQVEPAKPSERPPVLAPHDTIEWDVPQAVEEADLPDDEEGKSSRPKVNPAHQAQLQRPIFKPAKRWAWAADLSMDNPQVLMEIGKFLGDPLFL